MQTDHTQETPQKFNLKFLNYNNNFFMNSNNKFSTNFKSNLFNNPNHNTNQQVPINLNHQEYMIDDNNESFMTNQVNNIDIKSNNLNLLNINETYSLKSFTDPCCEEVYYGKISPRFMLAQSEKEPVNKMFPFIEENVKDDSFDYANLNEE